MIEHPEYLATQIYNRSNRRSGVGESTNPLKVQPDPRVQVEFRGATVTSDAGLLAVRELDEALGPTELSADHLIRMKAGGASWQQQPSTAPGSSMR